MTENELDTFGERLLRLPMTYLGLLGSGLPSMAGISAGSGSAIGDTNLLTGLQHAGAKFINAAKQANSQEVGKQAAVIEADLTTLLVIGQLQQRDFDQLIDELHTLKDRYTT